MSRLNPVPHTPLRDNPTEDAIWKRYLEQLWIKTAAWVSGPSSSTDNAVPRFNGTDGIVLQNSGVVIDDSNNVTGVVNLTTTGNTILGDASADTYTINAGTWTLGSNYTATRAAGALGAGATNILTNSVTATSDSGGGTNARALRYEATFSGSNPWTAMQTFRMECSHAGSALSGSQTGQIANVSVDGAGGTTNFNGFLVQFTLSSSGNAATGAYYQTQAPTLSSTGAFSNLVGFNSSNIGHATLVTNAFGFRAEEITASATLTVGFESQVSSGTGKWGFRHSGTANNAFNGNVRIGSNVAPTVALDVTGAAIISTSLTVGGALTASANVRVAHGTSALATNATEGFLHLQSCAGAPTGVPASIPTGQIPMVIDSTNLRIYAYIGGAWKSVAVA